MENKMILGAKIKKIRLFRGMTQRELGIKMGYGESSADVRIAQYETGKRTPKKDVLVTMAEILKVNPTNFICNATTCGTEFIQMFLWMENELKISPIQCSENRMGISMENEQIKEFLLKWMYQKKLLKEEKLTEQEYLEWKLSAE